MGPRDLYRSENTTYTLLKGRYSKMSERACPFSLFQAMITCSSSSEQKQRSKDSLSKSMSKAQKCLGKG